MVTFDHRDPGTPELEWAGSAHWASLPQLDASRIARLIVVAAHPDDETLGAGGLMQRVSRAGGEVCVVLASDGEGSHAHSTTHTPEQIRAMRVHEVERAAQLLAPGSTVVRLGLTDGALKHHAVALRSAIERVVAAGDGPVAVAATWRGDGHGDHRTVGEACAAIARSTGAQLLEYPIWMWHWSSADDERTPWAAMHALVLSESEQLIKQRAIVAHQSQTQPLSALPGDEAVLSTEFAAHFARESEVFVIEPEPEPEPESTSSLPQAYFDHFYEGKTDPWGFETRWYEQRKRALTIASLPRPRFENALEIGCSIGVLTEELATRCSRLLATDIAEQPLRVAQQRLANQSHVQFRHIAAHEEWPPGAFDLIVVSELGYYLSAEALADLFARAAASLTSDGVLLACHWRHPVRDYPLSGDDVHAVLARESRLVRLVRHEEEDFVLELYSPPPAQSVARREGLV